MASSTETPSPSYVPAPTSPPVAGSACPVQVGQIIAGKFVVEKLLGEGGMGVVVAARHVHLHGRVALKFLLPHLCTSADFAARFVREAQASSRLTSDHVARVLDTGTLETGEPFLVMECLEGCNLDELLEVRGRLGVEDAVRYVLQAMEAVAEAHALGIVHRDLKPSNLFLVHRADGSQVIKVLDFGISKMVEETARDASLTLSNNVLGSPVYMSPEQIRSARQVDRRSDIWSLGVVLHELVVGTPPFMAETVSATLAAVVADEAPLVHVVRRDASPLFSQVVARCLAKKADDRYADLADLAFALSPFADAAGQASIGRIAHLHRHPQTAGASAPPADSGSFARRSASQAPLTTTLEDSSARRTSSRVLPLIAGACLLGAAVIASGTLWTRGHRGAVAAQPDSAIATLAAGSLDAPRSNNLLADAPAAVVEEPSSPAPATSGSAAFIAAGAPTDVAAKRDPAPTRGGGALRKTRARTDPPVAPPVAPEPAAAAAPSPAPIQSLFEDRR